MKQINEKNKSIAKQLEELNETLNVKEKIIESLNEKIY